MPTSPDRRKGREKPGGTETREVVIPPLELGGTLSIPRGKSEEFRRTPVAERRPRP